MHSLITSYLLQNKECILPGIGTLQIINTPATIDAAKGQLLPPAEEFIFKRETQKNSAGLVKYIADKKKIEESEAEHLLNNFCNEWREKIKEGGEVKFETVGTIKKDAANKRLFISEPCIPFLQPIPVKSLYRESEKPMSLEEGAPVKEANKFIRNKEVVVERSYWRLWALILSAIGLAFLIFHFKDHKLNEGNIGNQNHFTIDSAKETYTVPRK